MRAIAALVDTLRQMFFVRPRMTSTCVLAFVTMSRNRFLNNFIRHLSLSAELLLPPHLLRGNRVNHCLPRGSVGNFLSFHACISFSLLTQKGTALWGGHSKSAISTFNCEIFPVECCSHMTYWEMELSMRSPFGQLLTSMWTLLSEPLACIGLRLGSSRLCSRSSVCRILIAAPLCPKQCLSPRGPAF